MSAAGPPLRPAVFLDRDGTIIREREYLSDPAGVELVPGTLEALETLREAGWPYVIVTNQSGIARGIYSEADYHRVAARLHEILEEGGVPPEATRYCPHHPEETGPCDCRKPGTGMYRRAAAASGLDLHRSFYVGDKVTDVLPALRLGGRGILVRTGYGREQESAVPPEVTVVEDLGAAVERILESSDAVDPSRGLG
ncbi:MAG: HAD family hydrolase [Gemmatimonadota bacterium]